MLPKIISPKQPGYIDYGFAAGLLLIPRLLNMNNTAKDIYTALTDYDAQPPKRFRDISKL
jgi:hypothetical protein